MIKMKVKVKYYNVLQEALGKREETYQLKKNTDLAGLIKIIADNHGDKVRQMLYPNSEVLANHIRIFVNDKLTYELSTPLTDGAEIALFYAVVGG